MANRDLVEVLDRVLAVIPESETELRSDLKEQQDTAKYRAPEAMGQSWLQCGHVFARHMPRDESKLNDWQRKVRDIWVGRDG